MHKYKRLLDIISLEAVLSGKNVSTDLSKLKRGVTAARNEDSDWQHDLQEHFDNIVVSQQLVFQVMLLAPHDTTVTHLKFLAKGALKKSGIPKPTYA